MKKTTVKAILISLFILSSTTLFYQIQQLQPTDHPYSCETNYRVPDDILEIKEEDEPCFTRDGKACCYAIVTCKQHPIGGCIIPGGKDLWITNH